MDNLKTFLDSVMAPTTPTTTRSSRPVVDPSKIVPHASAKQPSGPATYSQLQPNGNHGSGGIAVPGAGGSGRNRTESESSVASDISSVSSDSAGLRQMKRKDSEPYFWIM